MQDIERRQGLSIRFMKDGSTEAGAYQAGADNADIGIVDNYPLEVVFHDRADYDFVLDQIGKNAVLNLAMIDGDVSYGIFDLKAPGRRSRPCAMPAPLRGQVSRPASRRPRGFSTAAAGPSLARSSSGSSRSRRTSGMPASPSTARPCVP